MDRSPPRRAEPRRLLLAILIVALLIRLAWGQTRPTDDAALTLLPDQAGYLELGRNLLRGVGLRYVDERFEQTLYAARTPGYPVFVAVCGGSVRAIRVAQALLDTSMALAVYLLARRLRLREPRPLIAAALVALNPFLVYFSALVLTETLYTSMLAWAMLLLLRPRAWVWGLVLLALGVHVRPSGVALPALLVIAAFWLRAGRSKALGAGALAAAMIVVVLFPWAGRNHRVLGRWLWFTSNDGITLYDGFNPAATGASDQSFVERMPEVRSMGELERSEFFESKAKRFMRENPRRAVELIVAKVGRTWSPVPLSAEFGRPSYRAIALLYVLPFDALIIVGLVAGKLGRPVALFLVLPALYFTAVHAISVGSLRYRIPVEPPLAIVAAAGVTALWDGAIKRRGRDARATS